MVNTFMTNCHDYITKLLKILVDILVCLIKNIFLLDVMEQDLSFDNNNNDESSTQPTQQNHTCKSIVIMYNYE